MDIWSAFARSAVMLAVVLALVVFLFYLVKRFSAMNRGGGGRDLIRVLSVHHLSPKEKVVLLDVMEEKILIGVTQASINFLANIDKELEADVEEGDETGTWTGKGGFSALLNRKISAAGILRRGQKRTEEGQDGS
ncbi:MAG: flagellar biosynthetic protein FliO [Desulfobacteraceae bacterium]